MLDVSGTGRHFHNYLITLITRNAASHLKELLVDYECISDSHMKHYFAALRAKNNLKSIWIGAKEDRLQDENAPLIHTDDEHEE